MRISPAEGVAHGGRLSESGEAGDTGCSSCEARIELIDSLWEEFGATMQQVVAADSRRSPCELPAQDDWEFSGQQSPSSAAIAQASAGTAAPRRPTETMRSAINRRNRTLTSNVRTGNPGRQKRLGHSVGISQLPSTPNEEFDRPAGALSGGRNLGSQSAVITIQRYSKATLPVSVDISGSRMNRIRSSHPSWGAAAHRIACNHRNRCKRPLASFQRTHARTQGR